MAAAYNPRPPLMVCANSGRAVPRFSVEIHVVPPGLQLAPPSSAMRRMLSVALVLTPLSACGPSSSDNPPPSLIDAPPVVHVDAPPEEPDAATPAGPDDFPADPVIMPGAP